MKVRLIKTCKPICFNLEKWDNVHSPLLLVTGLSGSGKTTLAQKLAKHHRAICISFDVLKFNSKASKQSQKLLALFLEKHPEIKTRVQDQWKKTDKLNSNDILFNYYCNLFFDFLVEYALQHKKKIILEGIQVFVRMQPSKSINFPIIIIRSSGLHSFFNKIKRDYYTHAFFLIRDFKFIINDICIYYIRQRKLLNTYITYLYIIYENILEGEKETHENHSFP